MDKETEKLGEETDELVKTVRQLIRDNRKFLEHLDADDPDGTWDEPEEAEDEGEEELLGSS